MTYPDDDVEPVFEEPLSDDHTGEGRVSKDDDQPTELKALPTLQFYQKTYANSCSNNDAKAIKLFREYESRDRQQRLKQELIAVSQKRVGEQLCNRLIGMSRKGKYNGFDKWALFALGILNSKA